MEQRIKGDQRCRRPENLHKGALAMVRRRMKEKRLSWLTEISNQVSKSNKEVSKVGPESGYETKPELGD